MMSQLLTQFGISSVCLKSTELETSDFVKGFVIPAFAFLVSESISKKALLRLTV